MLIIRKLNLISVQSWTYLAFLSPNTPSIPIKDSIWSLLKTVISLENNYILTILRLECVVSNLPQS